MRAILCMQSYVCNSIAESVQEKLQIFYSKHLWTVPLTQSMQDQHHKKIVFSLPGITVATFCYCKMSYQKLFMLNVMD